MIDMVVSLILQVMKNYSLYDLLAIVVIKTKTPQ